jgi:hypothetical protein
MRMHNPPHPGEVLRDYVGGVPRRFVSLVAHQPVERGNLQLSQEPQPLLDWRLSMGREISPAVFTHTPTARGPLRK